MSERGRQLSKAWKAWLKSEEGQACAHPLVKTNSHLNPKYLVNRLERAFMAGAESVVAATPEQPRSEP